MIARRRRPGTSSPRGSARRRRATAHCRGRSASACAGSGTIATPWRPSRVGIAQSKVSMPSSTPRMRSSTSPIPSRWRGLSGAWASSSCVVQSTTSYICGLSSPSEPPIATPPVRARGDGLRRAAAKILVHAALDDPVDDLALGSVLVVPGQAALEPAVGALGRALRVLAADVERRALVEDQRDVGAERGLDRHRGLGAHEQLVAVDVGPEGHALLLDPEDRPAPVRAVRPTGP